jgi:hypothetical protein
MSFPTPKTRKKKPAEPRGGFVSNPRVHIAALLLVLVVGAPIVTLYSIGYFDGIFSSRVTLENYEALKVGMSEREIRGVLGEPSGFDRSAIPRIRGRGARFASNESLYPLRFIWRNEQDLIWADVIKKRVIKFGATFDGERYGADPDPSKIGQPERKPGEEGPSGEGE